MQNRIIAFFVLTVVLCITSDAEALHRSSGRKVTGCVESINSTTRMIVIDVDSDDCAEKSIEVKWSDLTKGEFEGKTASFENLRTGSRVTARYFTPLFGPPVLRAINWCETDVDSSICNKP